MSGEESCKPKSSKEIDRLPLPNGRMGLPFVGRTLEWKRDPEFSEKVHAEHGPVSKMSLFGEKTVLISGLEKIKQVMLADPPCVEPSNTKAIKALLGRNSLLFMDGKEHARIQCVMRKTMTPESAECYAPYIAETAKKCLETMAEIDGPVQFQDYIRGFSFDVVFDCIAGIDVKESSRDEMSSILSIWWAGFNSLGIGLPFTKFSKSMKARTRILELVRMTIKRIREDGDDGKGKALELLLEAKDDEGNGLTDDEIEDNILTLIFVGYDTIATVTMAVLFELQQSKESVEQAMQEQEAVVKKYGNELTNKSLGAMVYLDAIIKETLRLNPTFTCIIRKCSSTFEVGGYRVPKGWKVMFGLGVTGKLLDDRWLGDLQFNPSRFMTGDGSEPGAQIQWGIGPHSCLAQMIATMELKIFLASMLRDYEYHTDATKKPSIDHVVDGMPTTFDKKRI